MVCALRLRVGTIANYHLALPIILRHTNLASLRALVHPRLTLLSALEREAAAGALRGDGAPCKARQAGSIRQRQGA